MDVILSSHEFMSKQKSPEIACQVIKAVSANKCMLFLIKVANIRCTIKDPSTIDSSLININHSQTIFKKNQSASFILIIISPEYSKKYENSKLGLSLFLSSNHPHPLALA